MPPARGRPPSALAVTIDYRDILGELLERRLATDPSAVFPQHAFTRHGVAL